MVLTGHLELANFVKSVHEELRVKTKLLGAETAWTEHCKDGVKLEKYAVAMKELATQHWENSFEDNPYISRISWVYNACRDYFSSDIFNIRDKEMDIKNKMNICTDKPLSTNRNNFFLNCKDKLRLLDVGSCYNPFQHFDNFEVTAIDIAPANTTVFKCDFINLKISDHLHLNNTDNNVLPETHFDIVVFSLFLEYLPCPKQRHICCENAYRLLKPEGILVIVTPDSNHIGVNTKFIKSWQFILAKIGFSRIKYEKLKHIHCMTFRKVPSKEITLRWVDIYKNKQVFDEIYIPQDFKNKISEVAQTNVDEKLTSADVKTLNEELPFCNGGNRS